MQKKSGVWDRNNSKKATNERVEKKTMPNNTTKHEVLSAEDRVGLMFDVSILFSVTPSVSCANVATALPASRVISAHRSTTTSKVNVKCTTKHITHTARIRIKRKAFAYFDLQPFSH